MQSDLPFTVSAASDVASLRRARSPLFGARPRSAGRLWKVDRDNRLARAAISYWQWFRTPTTDGCLALRGSWGGAAEVVPLRVACGISCPGAAGRR